MNENETAASHLVATLLCHVTRPVEYLRADAARNVHRIVEVAARLLGEDPSVGMAEVAAAAGVSRATVYRHFPTREALIAAIQAQAIEQSEQALLACRLDEGSATEALRRLCTAWLDVAERYAFASSATTTDAETLEHRRRVLGDPLRALIERGKAAGEFSPALSTDGACAASARCCWPAPARSPTARSPTRRRPTPSSARLHEGLRA